MYKIYVDGNMVQGDGRLVISPVLTEKIGAAGTLKYRIPYNDPLYDAYIERVSTVTVFEDGITVPMWEGRLFTSEKLMDGSKELEFFGAMSYLNDIMYPPFEYSGDVPEFIEMVLGYYNSKCEESRKILPGSITVVDPNGYIARSDSEYTTIWKLLDEKLVKSTLKGYLLLRYDSDGNRYLDYLTDPGLHNAQKIEFGVNLLDIEHYIDATDIATVLIPIGAEIEDDEGNVVGRVDITTAAENESGANYIETELVSIYGRIEQVVEFDDVTEPDNLYRKAKAYAEESVKAAISITTNVVDMHIADDTIQKFNIGDYVDCDSPPHKISVTLMISERKRNLNNPGIDKVKIGNTQKSFTESASANMRDIEDEASQQKQYNANLADRISKAKGMYASVEVLDDGSEIQWWHDQPQRVDSKLIMQVSDIGVHLSGDGGATWHGMDFNGEFLANLIETYKISANRIYGGTLSSIAVDSTGTPITYIDMDTGEVAKLGNIGWIKRDSGNESLKWMGDE